MKAKNTKKEKKKVYRTGRTTGARRKDTKRIL
jgi:hypothetical protein